MNYINRRRFLGLSLTGAGAVLLSQCATTPSKAKTVLNSSLKGYTSTDGLLKVDLQASPSQVKIGGQQAQLLTYNGQFPGSRLEAKPGDTVQIRFTNNLSQTTNVHYHGLHIPPTGTGDNVFISVAPKESHTYEFTIPKNHRPSTYWYHPHQHHISAEQVFAGLAGLFVIRGELDEIPEVKAAQEEFLVFHDFSLDNNGRVISPNHHSQMMGREGNLITVNGEIQPTFNLSQGGLLRVHFVNTSASRFYRLSLENHTFHLIATDGGAISQPVELQELLLTPGERAEVLIQGNQKPGQYRLLNLPYDRGSMGMMGGHNMGGGMMNDGMMGGHNMGGGMMNDGMMGGNNQTTEILASFVYKGSISPLALPKKLITVEALPEPKTVRRIELSMGTNTGEGMSFLINGKTFDHQRIDTKVSLNTVEDWELVNLDSDRMEHPFHLHINPFQVISRNGKPEPYLAWKDTVLVRQNETVRIRMKFADFPGKTVYHCHILDHEDLGMMGMLEII